MSEMAKKLAHARAEKARKHLRCCDYYTPANNESEVVCACKCCGAPLISLVPHERAKFNGMPLAVPMATNEYAELEIEFDDGSKHVTPMCKKCVEHPDDLESIYGADLASWEKTSPDMDWEKVAGRKPVKARRVK